MVASPQMPETWMPAASSTELRPRRTGARRSWLVACLVLVGCRDCKGCSHGQTNTPEVHFADGMLDVRVQQMPRRQLVEQLSAQIQASLTVHGELAGSVTLTRDAASVSAVLAELLADQPYRLEYRPDAHRHDLPSAIVIGAPHEQGCTASPRDLRVAQPALAEPELIDPEHAPTELIGQLPEATAYKPGPDGFASLRDEEPQLRAAAVTRTPPVGSGRDQLRRLLVSDGDPAVRAQAARQLAGGDDYASTHALLGALGDDDDKVVTSAIHALVEQGDPSIVPMLREALTEHPGADVQRELRWATQQLQQGARRDPELPSVFEYAGPARAAQAGTTTAAARAEQGGAANAAHRSF